MKPSPEGPTVEHFFEKLPRRGIAGCLYPKIGGVDSAIDPHAELSECLVHQPGVAHIIVDGLLDLLLALGGVDGLGSPLRDVACAVEFRALTAIP